jgi:CHAT domain-containing protein/tetratricopeptide (TPR) repeat protein
MPLKVIARLVFLLIFCYSAYPQTTLGCAPESDSPECQVTNAAKGYLAALQKKDWNHLSQLGIYTRSYSFSSYPGTNLALRQLQVLLAGLDVQVMTAVVGDVEFANSAEARVRYSLRIKAVDPSTGNTNIDLSDANRVILMRRICNCQEPKISWLIERDSTSQTDLKRDLEKAKTADERMFVLLGSNRDTLEDLSKILIKDATSHLESSRISEAFAAFALANRVAVYFQNEESASAQLDVETAERRISDFYAGSTSYRLADQVENAIEAYVKLKEYDKALKCYERNVKQLGSDPESLAHTYQQVGNIYLARGDHPQGISYYRKSFDLLISIAPKLIAEDSLGDDFSQALITLMFLYQMEGQNEVAEELFRDANARINNNEFRAGMSFFHGLMQWMRGNISRALADGEKAFELISKSSASDETQEAMFGISFMLSMIYSAQGDYRHAAENLRRARAHFVVKDEEDMPEEFIKMIEAMFYGAEGAEAIALPRLESVFQQTTGRLTGELTVPDTLTIQAIDYLRRDQPEIGFQCWEKALEFAAELNDTVQLTRIHNFMAAFYASKNEHAKAMEHYNASLAFSQQDRSVLGTFVNQGTNTSTLIGIAQIQGEQGNHNEEIATYQKILNNPTIFALLTPEIYKSIAEAYYSQGKHKESLNEFLKGIEVAEKSGNRTNIPDLYQFAGRVHWNLGEYSLAQSKFDMAITEIERNRGDVVGGDLVLNSFFEERISPYHDMISLLISRDDTNLALTYAERVKSRVLLDALKRGRTYAGKFMSETEQQEEKTLRTGLISLNRKISEARENNSSNQQIDAWRAQRAAARLDYEVFKANLYVNHPELLSEPPKEEFSLKSLKHSLPNEDTALLEYVVTDTESYLFVIYTEPAAKVPSGARSFLQRYTLGIGGRDLADKVSYFRLRASHPEAPIEEPAGELYRLLLKPAEKQLMGRKNLIIIPDASLWDLPFQALKPSKEVFLIDEKAISYAPSLVALEEIRKARSTNSPRPRTLLAVGNPRLRQESEALPKTQELAKKLQALYGKRRSKILVGLNADEEHMKTLAARYGIIHIGSHGVLDDQNPMYSYVALAETGLEDKTAKKTRATKSFDVEKDGVLEAWELMDFDLKAELVVLSACETARGRLAKGEGVVGLTWALFMAGVPTTVVSQWKVESESTNELMFLFHKNFLASKRLEPKVSAAQALQRSAIALKKSEKYRHPYYWAGFVVMGDGAQ